MQTIKLHNLLPIGSLLADRYEIMRYIGAGGFAQVFEGFDSVINRKVAIKVLALLGANTQDSGNLQERFEREAEAAARIDHKNIVTVFDMGTAPSGHPYIVMEYLEGYDLDEELEAYGELVAKRVHEIVLPALDGLACAHQLGIVHRDLKPSNIYLTNPRTDREEVRVLDFGIAILGTNSERLTADGQMFGTPNYMPPEYIEDSIVVPGMDVYQMALIYVELLTGKTVVAGNSPVACVAIHALGALPLPLELIESPVGPILCRALHIDPEERYQDAGAFYDALDAIDPSTIPSPSPDGPIVRLNKLLGERPELLEASHAPPPARLTSRPRARPVLREDAPHFKPTVVLHMPSPQTVVLDQPTGRSRIGLWIAAVAVAGAIAVVGLVVAISLMGQPGATQIEAGENTGVSPPNLSNVAPTVKDEGHDQIEVEILSIPMSAGVYRGAVKLGNTPMVHTFESAHSHSEPFVLKHEGYEDHPLLLSPASAPSQNVSLKRLKVEAAEQPRADREASGEALRGGAPARSKPRGKASRAKDVVEATPKAEVKPDVKIDPPVEPKDEKKRTMGFAE